jgi:hypothetical protein
MSHFDFGIEMLAKGECAIALRYSRRRMSELDFEIKKFTEIEFQTRTLTSKNDTTPECPALTSTLAPKGRIIKFHDQL